MTERTLVLGGARSGKSGHAESLLPATGPASYLATARRLAGDPDWDARIAAHLARRPPEWTTVETPNLTEFLSAATVSDPPILVDDLATWLTGELDDAGAWNGGDAELATVRRTADDLVAAVARCPARLVLVSAEVGLGVVPPSRSGRLFRDELGSLNARLAEVCDHVVLLVAGLAVALKNSGGIR